MNEANLGIRLLAAKYHLNTELYDLTLPGYFSRHTEWIPLPEYLGHSSRFAAKERDYFTKDLSDNQKIEFQNFLKEYSRYSIEKLDEEIELLEKLISHDQKRTDSSLTKTENRL